MLLQLESLKNILNFKLHHKHHKLYVSPLCSLKFCNFDIRKIGFLAENLPQRMLSTLTRQECAKHTKVKLNLLLIMKLHSKVLIYSP